MTPEIEKRINAVKAGRVPAGYKKTKVGIVPKEWEVVSFGSISFKTGRKKKKDEDFPIYSINNRNGFCPQSEQFENDGYANTSKDSYTLVEKNTFAYNPARINIGSIGLLKEPEKVIISSLYVCFGLNNQCDLKFFEAYFKSYRFNYDVLNYNEGSVRQYLFYDNFAKINVAVPPLEEQKKIAEILSAQDKIIELKEKLIAEKQRQKKYLMQSLLDENIKRTPFKINGVVIDKSKWQKKCLGNVCDFLDNLRKPVKENDRKKGIYPYYGASGIIDYVDDYLFDGTYILLGEDGANIIFRSTPLAFKVSGKIWVNNHAHILLPKDGNSVDFYVNYLESLNYEKYNTGTAQPKLNQDVVEKIVVNHPSLPEQQAIAAVLSSADEEISLLQRDLEQEKLKKKSLMQLLLTGLVRVK